MCCNGPAEHQGVRIGAIERRVATPRAATSARSLAFLTAGSAEHLRARAQVVSGDGKVPVIVRYDDYGTWVGRYPDVQSLSDGAVILSGMKFYPTPGCYERIDQDPADEGVRLVGTRVARVRVAKSTRRHA